jgi:hypothetical protein
MQRRTGTIQAAACSLSILLLCASSVLAQSSTVPQPDTAASDSLDTRRARWSLLPILFSSPDTRFAFGVLPQYFFYLGSDSRPSNLRLDAYYTLNRQYSFQFRPQIWLKGNTYRLAGALIFREWPTDFYGVGADFGDDFREKFTENEVSFTAEAQRQLRPGLFAGARYALRWARIKETAPGGVLESGTVTGSGTGAASGIGILLSWDTRDNVYSPSSGSFHQASADIGGRLLGSDYRFDTYTLDLRRYFSPAKRHVLALQAGATVTTGDPPFRLLPGVGSDLRGYSSVRFVDRCLLMLQAEYRVVPIWWRLGLTLFGGVADVAHDLGAFDFADPKWAVGVGVRFLLYRDEKITVRQDFGFGRDSSGDYLDLNEAF